MDTQAECKILYRKILKMTHPDNYYSVKQSIPKGVEVYLSTLRNNATKAYEREDIVSLNSIIAELNGEMGSYTNDSRGHDETSSGNDHTGYTYSRGKGEDVNLVGFFKNHGIEVIDKRKKGGALWIIGSEKEIGDVVKAAAKKFHVTGHYSKGGRATKHMPAWWTTDDK